MAVTFSCFGFLELLFDLDSSELFWWHKANDLLLTILSARTVPVVVDVAKTSAWAVVVVAGVPVEIAGGTGVPVDLAEGPAGSVGVTGGPAGSIAVWPAEGLARRREFVGFVVTGSFFNLSLEGEGK